MDSSVASSSSSSQQSRGQSQMRGWVKWTYPDTAVTPQPQDNTDTRGFDKKGGVIYSWMDVSRAFRNNEYFKTVPSDPRTGRYFLRKDVVPYRTEDKRGKGYSCITVTPPNTPQRRITAAWEELVPILFDDFPEDFSTIPPNLFQGWRDSLPFINGAGFEKLENGTYFIHVWTSVETHENIDVKGHVEAIIKDITTRVLRADPNNIVWFERPHGLHNLM